MFKLLLVEDDELVRFALSRRLKSLCDVTIAVNGQEALDKLAGEAFDLIVSDVDMPVMNGIEFFRRVKKDFPLFRKRFVFLTGRPEAVENLGVRVLEKVETSELVRLVKLVKDGLDGVSKT